MLIQIQIEKGIAKEKNVNRHLPLFNNVSMFDTFIGMHWSSFGLGLSKGIALVDFLTFLARQFSSLLFRADFRNIRNRPVHETLKTGISVRRSCGPHMQIKL